MTDFLIVVDMQRDFVSGPLGSEQARAIIPAVAERIRRAKEAGTQVIFTLDTHEADYMDTREGRNLPVAHCMRGTQGWALEPEVAAQCARGMLSFEKPAFGSLALSRHLCEQALVKGAPEGRGMTIELCGVCTDICVISNALLIRAMLPEADIIVDGSLCAGVTAQKHEAALQVMRSCQIEVK